MSKVFVREFGVSEVRVEGAFEKNVFDGFDSVRTFWAVGTWGVCSTPRVECAVDFLSTTMRDYKKSALPCIYTGYKLLPGLLKWLHNYQAKLKKKYKK